MCCKLEDAIECATFPFLRNAVPALQLVSPKVEDILPAFLSASDVNKLNVKLMVESTTEAEALMAAAWTERNEAVTAGSLTQDQGVATFGRLAIRCGVQCT